MEYVNMEEFISKNFIGSRVSVFCGGESFTGQVVACKEGILSLKIGHPIMYIAINKIVSIVPQSKSL